MAHGDGETNVRSGQRSRAVGRLERRGAAADLGEAGDPCYRRSPEGRSTMIIPGPDAKIYPIVKVAIVLDLLREEGVGVDLALAGTGIAESDLASPRSRVSLRQVVECYRNIIRLTRNPQFAYHAGLRFHISAYGMYGFAVLSSTDFRQTMRFIEQYHELATPLADVAFCEEHGQAIWRIAPMSHAAIDSALYRFLVELQVGIFTTIHRDIMGPSFRPDQVHMTYGPPRDSLAFPAQMVFPALFDQPRNEFRFAAVLLDQKAELGNQITYASVVKLCDALLEELELRAGLAGRVRHAFLVRGPKATRFDDIAADLGMSPRTLRRRLWEQGTTFRDLTDELRAEMAIKYLRETDLPVDDIGEAMGFSEPGNFRRAFRRWTKAAPRRFRDVRPRDRIARKRASRP
jgi:AraC-like DNA-binding protein